MTLLRVTIFACFPFVTLGWMSCPQSIPTVSIVSRCPSNAKEWMMAAEKKDCGAMQKHQNCSNDGSFVYHCVLNEDATKLMDVCAPIWYLSGYCARFSIANKRLVNNPGLDCTKSPSPCPARFPSNESFKYQMCYQNVTSFNDTILPENTKVAPKTLHCEQEQTTVPVITAFLVIFGIISVCLLILLIFGKKIKEFLCNRRQREKVKGSDALLNEDNTPLEEKDKGSDALLNEDNTPLEASVLEDLTRTTADEERNEDSKEEMRIITLSGIDKGWTSLKDVKNIGNLRSKLSKELGHKIGFLWIVDKENGKLYQDDIVIDASRKTSYTLMLGKENRTNDCNVDGNEDLNSNGRAAKCRMNCGHSIVVETILELIRDTLAETEFVELKCPLCSNSWEKNELVKKCNMSNDEKIFLDCVLEVNAKTKSELRQYKKY